MNLGVISMYITNIKIRNFRAIENLDLDLNKGLNVLIGENNSGKTSVIDLLRLIFDKGNYPNEIYWKKTDFRVANSSEEYKPIEFDIRFQMGLCKKFCGMMNFYPPKFI